MSSLEDRIKEAVKAYRPGNSPFPRCNEDQTALYSISDADDYNTVIDPVKNYRHERFQEATIFNNGILYRPQPVQEMKEKIFAKENFYFGLMVRGPQGVGKSHSLVNLVRSLRACGHIVTFLPDCEDWRNALDLIKPICRSLRTDASRLGIDNSTYESYDAGTFINVILEALEEVNRDRSQDQIVHWVLVFDQLNRIFARANNLNLKDVGALEDHFSWMKRLNKEENVHTVISASANNSLAYRESHEGFKVYEHPVEMSDEEIKIWKPECNDIDEHSWNELVATTGRCPLQVAERLRHESRDTYEDEAVACVLEDTRKLMEESDRGRKDSVTQSALHCLLSIAVSGPGRSSKIYDKKYSVLSGGVLTPVFPAVLIAYRILFWDELLDYVEQHEAEILLVCANPLVTNDVRGRLFELIVLTRFQKQNLVSYQPDMDVLPAQVDAGLIFNSQDLPKPSTMENNTLFIPKNSNFPAIDLILKSGKDVWAIQVHVADHEDVEPTFRAMCSKQGWFDDDAFNNIYLVYLSPSKAITESLSCIPTPSPREKKARLFKIPVPEIQISAISKDEIACLSSLQWPSIQGDATMVGTQFHYQPQL